MKLEYYPVMLDAFNWSMTEYFGSDIYNLRVQFCMSQLYNVVADIMTSRDFSSMVEKQNIASNIQFDTFMKNLDSCLENKQGRLYLELYMKQQFCVELMHFYKVWSLSVLFVVLYIIIYVYLQFAIKKRLI